METTYHSCESEDLRSLYHITSICVSQVTQQEPRRLSQACLGRSTDLSCINSTQC
jgi:hypothetical protein